MTTTMVTVEFWRLGFQGKSRATKKKKKKGLWIDFTAIKNTAHQARLNTAWERDGPFLTTTDTAEMMDGTLLHNGTVQRADFRLIHPAPRQSYQITTRTTRQPWRNKGLPHKEHKNLVLTKRTQESHEQPGLQQKNKWQLRRQDSFHYKRLKNRRLQILQDPTNSVPRKAK